MPSTCKDGGRDWQPSAVGFAVDPPPDLVVEIDLHHDSISKFPVYAGLGVLEIWRYDGREITIHHLESGRYVPADNSQALPMLSAETLSRFLSMLWDKGEQSSLTEFDRWLQSLSLDSTGQHYLNTGLLNPGPTHRA